VSWLCGRPRAPTATRAACFCGAAGCSSPVVFSFAQGIIHPYYTVAWRRPSPRSSASACGTTPGVVWAAGLVLAVALASTAVWSYVLLSRSPDWFPWLRPGRPGRRPRGGRGAGGAPPGCGGGPPWSSAVAGLGAALAGPAAYALDTVAHPHSGAIPSAGASVERFPVVEQRALGFWPSGPGPEPGGAGSRVRPVPVRSGIGVPERQHPGQEPGDACSRTNAGRYKWVAATVNSNSAAGYQLATDDPVMAIGGFNGTDPAPTLAQFETYVAHGDVHYFIASGGGFGGGGIRSRWRLGWGHGTTTTASQITSWVDRATTRPRPSTGS
jgi:hypothetical protein